MKKIFIKRVIHHESSCLAIIFAYDKDLIRLARGIPCIKYSGSQKFWYADDTEENLKEILRVFRDNADIDISAISSKSTVPTDVKIKNEMRSDENTGYDKGTSDTLVIKNQILESNDDDQFFVPRTIRTIKSSYSPVEFRIDDKAGRLSVKFTGYYNKEWIDEIKTYGKVYYDRKHNEFLLAWSKITVDSLSDYFSHRDVEVRVIRPQVTGEKKERRKEFSDQVRSRELRQDGYEGLEVLRKYLEENRYSYRTIESYLALLELFFKFYNDRDPFVINQNDVSEFMNNFIIRNGFSGSYQNQLISVIKMFYDISGKGKVIPHTLQRPRRGRSLPKVFSKEEISRILNSTKNNKHKLLLWMIYSCGLRRSEVTNIMLTDLDRSRNLLHIREGKGGIDRVVPVPDRVWQKHDEYIEGFRPRRYLFEGQSGGRYSSESVYNVFKQALSRAGIKKEVGVHSLRHSYATHLHENGVDIRYIQELLGHRSTRTTEIYTHVSRRNLAAVRSPIEDLDLR